MIFVFVFKVMFQDWIPPELVRENVSMSPSQPREAMLDPLVEVWLASNIGKAVVPIIHFQNYTDR